MKSETVKIELRRDEQLALRALAFRAGASLEATVKAILQNAAGVVYDAESLNFRVVEESGQMPALRRRRLAA